MCLCVILCQNLFCSDKVFRLSGSIVLIPANEHKITVFIFNSCRAGYALAISHIKGLRYIRIVVAIDIAVSSCCIVNRVRYRRKLRRERRVLIQRIIFIICIIQFILSRCSVKNGVFRYKGFSLVPANEIITGSWRGFHIRQRFARQIAHRLLCVSIKCSVPVRLIGNVNSFTVRLVAHVDDRFPIHSNCFRFIFSYIGITGNLLSSRSDRLCFRTRLTGTCIIVNKLFARLINIANRIIRFNVFCIYLTIQMPRKRLINRKISCAIL